MNRFLGRSLRRKLGLLMLLGTMAALLVACATFVFYELHDFRRELTEQADGFASIIGRNTTAALVFNDRASAEETISALVSEPNVVGAFVFDRDGRIFARFVRAGTVAPALPAVRPEAAHQFTPDHLFLQAPITHQGEFVGTIMIVSDLRALWGNLRNYSIIALLVFAVSSLFIYFLSAGLQRLVVDPVLEIAAIARSVATEQNYHVRVPRGRDDELGHLIDGFNHMLAQIQARDANLQQAHDQLEQRVAERTRELQEEVAERERSEQAVRESHQRFEIVTHATADVIWDRDMASGVVWRNDNFQLLFGYAPDEIEATPDGWAGCVHPDDLGPTLDRLRAALNSDADHWSAEYRFRRKDGVYAFILDRGHILRDRDGEPLRMMGAMQDVSALKQAQEAVAREKARLELIFESVPVGICLDHQPKHGPRHRMLNAAHLEICGLRREEAVVGVFQRLTHPEDAGRQAVFRDQLDRGLIRRFSLEKRYVRPDGRTVWVVYSIQRDWYADGGWQDLSTIVEITDLKHAQEQTAREQARFKFIFDAVPIGFTWMKLGDPGTRIVNPAYARITGVPVECCHDLERYRQITHPDDQARQHALHLRFLAGEIAHYEIEKRYRLPDGTINWATLAVSLYHDPQTGERQEISTVVDVTARKLAEASLAETHRQLLDISRQAGMAEVATGVLHNVGNVLNSVNVSTTLLSDQVRKSKRDRVTKLAELFREQERDLAGFFATDARARQIPGFLASLAEHLAGEQGDLLKELEALRKNIEHIKEIVAMQQNYAKVSGVSETVAVTDLVEDALRMNAGAFVRHDVTLVREFQAQPVVTVEKHKVLQILVNLMRNAKYACDDSGRKDKRMTIRITREDDRVRVAVIDNGVGIAPENLTRIFAHGFTTRKNGHGFGLHSGALAARELGGSLSAHSPGLGHGAAFVLELPEEVAPRTA